jgi:hypothetical protein
VTRETSFINTKPKGISLKNQMNKTPHKTGDSRKCEMVKVNPSVGCGNELVDITLKTPFPTRWLREGDLKQPLEAKNLTEAHRKLLVERSEGRVVFCGQAPFFEEYAQPYFKQQGHKTKDLHLKQPFSR